LKFSTGVDLFCIVSGWAGRFERNWPPHPPHSKRDDLRPHSAGHLDPNLPIRDPTAHGGKSETRRKTHGNQESNQETEEGQEAPSNQDVGPSLPSGPRLGRRASEERRKTMASKKATKKLKQGKKLQPKKTLDSYSFGVSNPA
jgi:hypothetical protein